MSVTLSKCYNNLITGECFKIFWNQMPNSRKSDTLLKTALVAAAVGLIGALIKFPLGIIFAVAGGLAAFTYYTTAYSPQQKLQDYLSVGLENAWKLVKEKSKGVKAS
jgi:hypothetical protein